MDKRQLGGISFLVGNAALFANGLIAHLTANTPESRKAGIGRMSTAALWAGSGVLLTRYGSQSAEHQMAQMQEKLSAHLQKEGVPLDAEHLRKADAYTKRGWWQKIEEVLYDHPIEASNAYTALAGTGMAVSGLLRRRDGNSQAGNANLALSALVVVGALASILIPEKTKEQVKAKGQEGTLWGNIQEKPLHYVIGAFLAGDLLEGMEALGEYKTAQKLPAGNAYKPWQFGMSALSLSAMSLFLAGDWLTGSTGSKKVSISSEEQQVAHMQLVQETAQLLSQLPENQRQQLAESAAEFLTKQPGLRMVDFDSKQLTQEILDSIHAHATSKAKPVLGAYTQKVAQLPSSTNLGLS